jgi:hypothetical protein
MYLFDRKPILFLNCAMTQKSNRASTKVFTYSKSGCTLKVRDKKGSNTYGTNLHTHLTLGKGYEPTSVFSYPQQAGINEGMLTRLR